MIGSMLTNALSHIERFIFISTGVLLQGDKHNHKRHLEISSLQPQPLSLFKRPRPLNVHHNGHVRNGRDG